MQYWTFPSVVIGASVLSIWAVHVRSPSTVPKPDPFLNAAEFNMVAKLACHYQPDIISLMWFYTYHFLAPVSCQRMMADH